VKVIQEGEIGHGEVIQEVRERKRKGERMVVQEGRN
jgi:hypothetical protein